MGPLALPVAGLVYLDASGLIYSVERVEYRTLTVHCWNRCGKERRMAISPS